MTRSEELKAEIARIGEECQRDFLRRTEPLREELTKIVSREPPPPLVLRDCGLTRVSSQASSDVVDVDDLAKILNGPFYRVPEDSKYTLDELREVRWAQTGESLRALLRQQARAAISAIPPAGGVETQARELLASVDALQAAHDALSSARNEQVTK